MRCQTSLVKKGAELAPKKSINIPIATILVIKNTANRPLSPKAETGSEKNNLQWKYSKGAEWKPVKKHPPITSQEVLKM